MHKIIIILISILVSVCKSEQKNLNELEPATFVKTNIEKSKSNILLDTLVFDKSMNGEFLLEKYAFGLQELEFYKQFVSENIIAEKQTLEDEHSKSEITYLGKLMDLDHRNYYHVITNFKITGIGEMESPRGTSNIVFLSDNLDKALIYRMGMPDELPERIENNILYFILESEKIGISISGGLPPMLCLPKIGCN